MFLNLYDSNFKFDGDVLSHRTNMVTHINLGVN